MTKKDYIIIAKIMYQHSSNNPAFDTIIKPICRDLANAMAQDNPRFDQQRFLIACGFSS